MEMEINVNPSPPVKTRHLLALGYIKYRSNAETSGFESGPATSSLQVHGLLVIDESSPIIPVPCGSEGNHG